MSRTARKYYAMDVPDGAKIAEGEHAGAVVLRKEVDVGDFVTLHLDAGYALRSHPATPWYVLVPVGSPVSLAELGD